MCESLIGILRQLFIADNLSKTWEIVLFIDCYSASEATLKNKG